MHFEKTTTPPPSQCDQGYPCPCRRGANLVPIYLTDAYGCDRCPQMFVMDEDGKLVEQLTAGYPYARAWRWTGAQWRMIYPRSNHAHPRMLRAFLPLIILVLGWLLLRPWLVGPFAWLYLVVCVLVITFVLPMVNAYRGNQR